MPAGGKPSERSANPDPPSGDGRGLRDVRRNIVTWTKPGAVACLLAMPALTATPLTAAVLPFTEDYAVDSAGWKDAASADPVYLATGGPDGSAYVSTSFSFTNSVESDTPVLLRGQDNFEASGDAFVGDWLGEGVTSFSAWVRHDAPVPLNFFARFAGSINFPGAVAVGFVPVLPDTWTQITFDISAANPQFVTFEGSDFNSVFSGIGNVQLGVSVSSSLAGYSPDVTFDLDQPAITPEPGSLLGLGCLAMGWVGLRNRA